MILDAAIEAKMETKLLEEWYCRDENSVPAAYYLRPKSEMLRSNKNAVSHPSLHYQKHSGWLSLPWAINLTAKSTLTIREMQTKTSRSYGLAPVRMVIIYKRSVFVRMWRKGTLVHCWGACKLKQPLWKTLE